MNNGPDKQRRFGRFGRGVVVAALSVLVWPGSVVAQGTPQPARAARAASAARAVPAPLAIESLTTATLEGAPAERVYVADVAISHISDGRIRVFGAADGRLLGMIPSAYAGNFTLSAGRDELYLATTHLSRTYRGERADVLEVWDTRTLGFKHEVLLPPRRAQALPYRHLVRVTGNGRFALVQNATPATSITVVDLAGRKVASEVSTPGCWGALPAATHGARFSMLCGDGTVATVTLDEAGTAADRQSSAKLFDPDADAWFHHAEQSGDRYWFLSFKGVLTELDLGGPKAELKQTRPLVSAADARSGWRPGGYQAFTVDAQGRWLVAAMHRKGAEGTHKNPAEKLWVVDLRSGQRRAMLPGGMAIAVNFSGRGDRLHVLDAAKGGLGTWSFADGRVKPLAYVPGAGEAASLVESHD